VPEPGLAELVETHALEFADDGHSDLVLRGVPAPWPFPPHLRVVPDVVVALASRNWRQVSSHPGSAGRRGSGLFGQSSALAGAQCCRDVVSSWTPARAPSSGMTRSSILTGTWSRCLFAAGPALERAEAAEALRISVGRRERAWAFLNLSPPHGLRLVEHAERLELVSAPDCSAVIERFLEKPTPEALTQAALEVLAVVAYEQPVTRAVISHIRGTDSSGVVDTLIAKSLIADDPRFGGRGRPSFLVTTNGYRLAHRTPAPTLRGPRLIESLRGCVPVEGDPEGRISSCAC
jgi:segregation and condensation protein B